MGFLWSEPLQPLFKISMQAGFVVVDKNARCDVHGIHKAEPLMDAALPKTPIDLGSDIQKAPA